MVVLGEGGFKSSTILRLRFRERGALFIFRFVVGFPRGEEEMLFNFLESAELDRFPLLLFGWNQAYTLIRALLQASCSVSSGLASRGEDFHQAWTESPEQLLH